MIYESLVSFPVLLGTFCTFVLFLLLLFRRAITSIFDPIIPFCAWAASVLAAGVSLFAIKPNAIFFYQFVFSVILIVVALSWLFGRQARKNSIGSLLYSNAQVRVPSISVLDWLVFWCLVGINVTAISLIFTVVLREGLESVFAARFFLKEEFRNPFLKIVEIVLRPILLAQAFRIYYLSHSKMHKFLMLITISLFSIVFFMFGSRSVMLVIVLLLGGTIVLYRRVKSPPSWSQSYLIFALIIVSLIATMSFATARFFDLAFYNAFSIVIDRFLLAADGIFMWVERDLQSLFTASPLELLNLIFGQFFGTLQQNFGWQLYEAYIGKPIYVPYGPNLIFPFQFYLASWAAPLWLVLSVAAAAFMRHLKAAYDVTDCCRIVIISYAFQHFQDPEYAAFFFGFLVVFWIALAIVHHLIIHSYESSNIHLRTLHSYQ